MKVAFKNPYKDIWFNTSDCIDDVLSGKKRFNFFIPILLSVLSTFLDDEVFKLEDEIVLSLLMLILMVLIFFGLFITVIPWLILKTGRIWKGKATKNEILVVMGLAQIPVLLLLIEQIIFLSLGASIPETGTHNLLQFIVWIFYLRIMIIGLSKVQGFNYTFALLNLILAILPLFMLRLLFI